MRWFQIFLAHGFPQCLGAVDGSQTHAEWLHES